jgi:ribosomal protein S18 acetylase RimI-like enzyme
VRQEHRSAGTGSEFLARLIAFAERRGVARIKLVVNAGNRALALYQRAGSMLRAARS